MKHVIRKRQMASLYLQMYSQQALCTMTMLQWPGVLRHPMLLKLQKILMKKFIFIINLITSIKITEDTLNQDLTLSLMEN